MNEQSFYTIEAVSGELTDMWMVLFCKVYPDGVLLGSRKIVRKTFSVAE